MTRALVTGAGGYVGGAIARLLLSKGFAVRSFSRGTYPELAALGIEQVRGDLGDASAAAAACKGCDAVFHVAARVGLWGPDAEFEAANIGGTANILAGCRSAGVGKLVFTSSPSVVFDGGDVEGWNESRPFPAKFDSVYSRTKAEAEKLVLAANGPSLLTVAIRPHLVWGPGTNHIISEIVARAPRLRRVGGFNKPVDTTFIDDAAMAHYLAYEKLSPGSPVCGRAYFISQGEPWPMWDLTNEFLAAAGKPPVTGSVPYAAAITAAWASEMCWRVLPLRGEPLLTRFAVHQICTAHWFDISAARKDLGYAPSVTIRQGLQQLKEWFGKRI